MQLNLDKSKIMVFRKGGPLRHYERRFYNESPIEVVSLYCVIGIWASSLPQEIFYFLFYTDYVENKVVSERCTD